MPKIHTFKLGFKSRTFFLGIFVFLFPSILVIAEDRLQLFYAQYQDDENLTVVTPVLRISKDWFDASTFTFRYGFERFDKSTPGFDGNNLDAISGASTVSGGSGGGFSEDRHEYSLSGVHNDRNRSFSWTLQRSDEEDFFSQGFSLGFSQDFLQRNFNLSAVYGRSDDKVITNTLTGASKSKVAQSFTISATQLLTQKLFASGGLNVSLVDGYQANPLRKVIVKRPLSKDVYEEVHPDTRRRYTVFSRGKILFNTKTSLDLRASYYNDNWGVKAGSIETRVHQYLSQRIVLRARYLYYRQGSADFYQELYTEKTALISADNRLRPHNINVRGIRLTYYEKMNKYPWQIGIGYDRYQESNNGLSADIFKLSTMMEY